MPDMDLKDPGKPLRAEAKAPTVLLKSVITMCMPDMARLLRDNCHFPRQRPLSDAHIERLAEEMRLGSFIAGTQIWLAVYPDKRMAILNGNHTLEAVCRAAIPIALTFTYMPCANEDDAGRVYSQFDIHKARSWGDSYRAYGLTDEIPLHWATPIGSATGWILAKFNAEKFRSVARSREIRGLMIKKYTKQAGLLMEIGEGLPWQTLTMFRRSSVLAIALETLRYQPTQAIEFWRPMLLDNGLKNGDPRKALLYYLRKTAGKRERTDQVLQANACALAWNAAFKDKPIEILRPAFMEVFHLAGTPWTGGDHDPMAELTSVKIYRPTTPVMAADRPSFTSGVETRQDGAKAAVVYYAP